MFSHETNNKYFDRLQDKFVQNLEWVINSIKASKVLLLHTVYGVYKLYMSNSPTHTQGLVVLLKIITIIEKK